jgi:RNA polymerase sigma-70 factor (ECF subfamily)
MSDDLNDAWAREMRTSWFRFVDAVAPLRADLHRYCLKLTANIWDAEDLLQDTLLRGFGAIGRGDLHGESSRVENPRAYLFRVASNLWIDSVRRRREETPTDTVSASPPLAAREAGEALFEHAAPQQRAAIVLKDVFAFSLEEIAVLLNTTPGAVKSALHRGRENLMAAQRTNTPNHGASKELVDRFVDAFNKKNVPAMTAALLETTSIEVHGVGGGRGNKGEWVTSSATYGGSAACFDYEGEHIMVVFEPGSRDAAWINRFEEADGRISRAISYCFTPETLAHVCAELGLRCGETAYHQAPETLVRMIATTTLPWES